MVQKVQSSKLGNRTTRLRLAIQKKPYFLKLDPGLSLGYRRTQTAGTWVMRVTKDSADWTQRIATADDHEESNGKDILTYGEAQTRARELAKGGKIGDSITVKHVLDHYEKELQSRGGDIANVSRARLHLTDKLAKKPVRSLTKTDFTAWRDHLIEKDLKPATVNRIMTSLRAALNLAAEDESNRIANREAWKTGLKEVEDPSEPRNVILDENDVRNAIGASYRYSAEFGLLVEVLAVTGARFSQAARLRGDDVQAEFKDPSGKRQPRLMMPVSRKGRRKKTISQRPVPITDSLAKRLSGRSGTLLVKADGHNWLTTNVQRSFKEAIEGVKLSQPDVTLYALRHTSIVRQLKAGVPIRVVAALHDTSVQMIERHYSKYIADVSDDLARPTLPDTIAEVITFPSEGTSP
jgi:integrase